MSKPDEESRTLPWTRLPLAFDAQRLRADLASIGEEEWHTHFNRSDFDGTWSGVALRSRSGRVDDIVPAGTVEEFRDTELMTRCANLRAVVEAFHFPLKSVRLLRLHAGSQVKEHRDRDLGLADGELRIHVPIATSEDVEFIVAGRQLRLREGEAWFIDFSQPHRIDNAGTEHRVHLLIDGTVNAWAEEMLAEAVAKVQTETYEPRGLRELARFQQAVYADDALRMELMAITLPDKLVEAALEAGRARGFQFKAADAESVLKGNREQWIMRSAL